MIKSAVFTGQFLFLIVCCGFPAWSQHLDTGNIFAQPVEMDEFVIKSGFDVSAFIRRVRTDTTFYKAFRSMHLLSYDAVNNIDIYSSDGAKIIAGQRSKTRQQVVDRCRTMKVLEEKTIGKFYKRNGEYEYYTAELFAYLFFTNGRVCNEDDIVAGKMDMRGAGRLEKNKYELKQLIFNPGSRVRNIPFMADRLSIFDEGEAEKYDFKISQEEYNGTGCFVFTIKPKKGYENKVLYKALTTWFRKSDYSILARDYSLSYHAFVYDFDVTMKVRTIQSGGKLYPSYISYDGNWHVFTKKRERVRFNASIVY